jgi:flavin-dependent dehydrogenase
MPAADAYDVVVLGAGAGGMTAAVVAAAQGLRVLVIEKTGFVGGTTAWSGGMVWIPVNAKMRDAALSDSRADAEAYLASPSYKTTTLPCTTLFFRVGQKRSPILRQTPRCDCNR